MGDEGSTTDEAFSLAHSRIHREGKMVALAKGVALPHDLWQTAGLMQEDLGRVPEWMTRRSWAWCLRNRQSVAQRTDGRGSER